MNCVWVAGVDEAGRGPLVGAVVAAAVILDPDRPIVGLADSKKLSERRREQLALEIRAKSLSWALGRAEVEEIDRLNILHASLLAMQRAILALSVRPELVLVDGNRVPPGLAMEARAEVRGDDRIEAISAASILAKTARDEEMRQLDQLYPHYGLARHKGYPTKEHLEALSRHGVTPLHRSSFGPVRKLLG
jgi:ribonuclease HII